MVSDRQREALWSCERNQLTRPTTMDELRTVDALWAKGLITWATDDPENPRSVGRVARLTQAGFAALRPRRRPRSQKPRYLQRDIWRGGDYTTEPGRSIDFDTAGAVEVLVTDDDLDDFAYDAAQRRFDSLKEAGDELDTLEFTRRVERLERVARAHHANINRDVRLIRYMHQDGRTNRAAARLRALEAQFQMRAA